MIKLNLGPDVVARSLRQVDAPAVHSLIAANRDRLDRWLRWSSALQSLADVESFIAGFETKEAAGDGFHLGIWDDGSLAGGAVCWYINRQNRNCEIGYWLGTSFTGRGLATHTSKAVMQHLFENEDIHRIEMQCGVENTGSRAVAERCGLTEEGIRRESHWITNRFVDHVVYGMLSTQNLINNESNHR